MTLLFLHGDVVRVHLNDVAFLLGSAFCYFPLDSTSILSLSKFVMIDSRADIRTTAKGAYGECEAMVGVTVWK